MLYLETGVICLLAAVIAFMILAAWASYIRQVWDHFKGRKLENQNPKVGKRVLTTRSFPLRGLDVGAEVSIIAERGGLFEIQFFNPKLNNNEQLMVLPEWVKDKE